MCQGSQGTGFTSIPIYCLEGNFDEMTIDGVRAMKMHCWHEMGQTYENMYHTCPGTVGLYWVLLVDFFNSCVILHYQYFETDNILPKAC